MTRHPEPSRVGASHDRRNAALWLSMFAWMTGLFASPTYGQTGWSRLSNQPPMVSPAWVRRSPMTYDTVRNESLAVVPFDLSGPGPVAVWAYDGNAWLQRPSQNAPAWDGHLAAFDSIRARLVLTAQYFGGLVQTWEWDGATWRQLFPIRAPRLPLLMTFDATRRRVVAWDENDYSTWEWDGTNWTRTAIPGPIDPAGMAYDAARGGVVLLTQSSETWLWNGTLWARRSTLHAPPPHHGSAMAYDSARQRLVLFGGSTGPSLLRSTWEWDGSDWIERLPTSAPSARFYSAATYDARRQRVVLFGGQEASTPFSDTWEWDGTDWSYRGPETVPAARSGHAMIHDERRQISVLFGGNRTGIGTTGVGTGDDLWEFDGTRWTYRSLLLQPRGRVSHAMTFDPVRGVALVFGGYWSGQPAGGILDDLWSWDGARWTQLQSTAGPGARGGHALAWDRARGRAVLFGGQDAYGDRFADTWTWDGAQWQQRTSTTSPAGRSWHALCFDAARGQTLLFGGETAGGRVADTWTWDGTSWLQQNPATSPSARKLHAMTWDSARQRVVMSGGFGNAGILSDTWEWDGRTWLPQAVARPHGPRYAHALAYEERLGRVLAFGGNDSAQRLQEAWAYEPGVRGAATPFGTGCAGGAGVPSLAAVGPPIVGNRDFALELGSAAPSSTVLIGLTDAAIHQPLPGGCALYLPSVTIYATQSSAAGLGRIGTPIPLDPALSGVTVFAQGFVLDPQGAFLGLAAFTQGLAIRIGD